MDPKDTELIQTLSNSNDEIRSLWNEHLELERQLETFNRKPRLSPEDAVEARRIKKIKLAGRDRIEAILAEHR